MSNKVTDRHSDMNVVLLYSLPGVMLWNVYTYTIGCCMIIGTRNSLGNTVCVWIHMFRSDIDEINYHHTLERLISTKTGRYIRVEV